MYEIKKKKRTQYNTPSAGTMAKNVIFQLTNDEINQILFVIYAPGGH